MNAAGKGRGGEVHNRVRMLHYAVNSMERRAVMQTPRKVQNTVRIGQYFLGARVQVPDFFV